MKGDKVVEIFKIFAYFLLFIQTWHFEFHFGKHISRDLVDCCSHIHCDFFFKS